MTIIVSTFLALCLSKVSYASGSCNWQCYLDRYEDLQKAFGSQNVASAERHWKEHGMQEKRDCTCPRCAVYVAECKARCLHEYEDVSKPGYNKKNTYYCQKACTKERRCENPPTLGNEDVECPARCKNASSAANFRAACVFGCKYQHPWEPVADGVFMFGGWVTEQKAKYVVKVEPNVYIAAVLTSEHLKMVKFQITGEDTFKWLGAGYKDVGDVAAHCKGAAASFKADCMDGANSVAEDKYSVKRTATVAIAAQPPAQCNKPEVLKRCKAWGKYSKEDNGCQAFANGWKKKSTNRCSNCHSTGRDYFACEEAECTALCKDMYRTHSGDKNRCIDGCKRYKELLEAPKVYVKGIVGQNTCPPRSSHIRNHEECKKAGDLLDGISTHRTPAGEWGHVPPYCSFQSGGDKSVHFNKRKSGKNDGGYTPICRRDPEGVDKDLRTAVPYTMDMINLSWRIYDGSNDGGGEGHKRKAGDILTVSTTNHDWKIAQVVSSRDGTGRIWLAEYYYGKTCALVVRGTEFKQEKSVMQNLTFSSTKMGNADYDIISGYQDHVYNIFMNDNNDEKIYAWLEKCSERGFKKMISGHSLGGSVATWLAIHLEVMPEKRRADYVVTFGAPRVVASYGSNRCPKSLQSRTRAVRIVTANTGIIGRFVDAAALLPPEMNNDHNEAFCFESLSLDGYGNLLEQNERWPNWSYTFTVNTLNIDGWSLHSSKDSYEQFLIKAKEKIAVNKKCYGAGTWCDDWGDFWGKGSCEKVCCFGAEWHITHHECKAEKTKVLPSGYWCDYNGIIRHSCGQCQKGFQWVWYKLRHECK